MNVFAVLVYMSETIPLGAALGIDNICVIKGMVCESDNGVLKGGSSKRWGIRLIKR